MKICLCDGDGDRLQNIKAIDLLSDRTQIDEYMFRLEQSQEQHYQEWLKKEPSEVITRLRSLRESLRVNTTQLQ